jgi:pyrroloquinoline-quinone synthase
MEDSLDLLDRIDDLRERKTVLRHSFYVRWSEGSLTRDDLALYAGQYRHAVVALADAAEAGSDPEHAAEERAHVDLWDEFAAAAGTEAPAEALPETAECARRWTAEGDELDRLVTLYAIEASQPPISKTKLEGLMAHYGFERGQGTEYFEVHSDRDHEHAARSRELIAAGARAEDEERLLARAADVLDANWTLLDGVERKLGANSGNS